MADNSEYPNMNCNITFPKDKKRWSHLYEDEKDVLLRAAIAKGNTYDFLLLQFDTITIEEFLKRLEMTDNEKYYTPKIEDLFIGYECETIQEDGSWKPIRINTFQHNISLSDEPVLENIIRTKYLDAEDLKELGLVDVALSIQREKLLVFENQSSENYFNIVCNKTTKVLQITNCADEYVFDGICPSKNELKKIMQLCQITH